MIDSYSSVTNEEYIQIKSTLHAIDNRDYICGDCQGKYSNRADGAQMLEKVKIAKGCEAMRPMPIHSIDTFDGKESIKFKNCIGNYFSYEVVALWEMQRQFEKGVMPYPGSLSEQPNKVIEAFNVIGAYRADRTERDRKRLEMEAKKRRGR